MLTAGVRNWMRWPLRAAERTSMCASGPAWLARPAGGGVAGMPKDVFLSRSPELPTEGAGLGWGAAGGWLAAGPGGGGLGAAGGRAGEERERSFPPLIESPPARPRQASTLPALAPPPLSAA